MRIVLLTGEKECTKCRETKALLRRVAERFPAVEVEVLKSGAPEAADYGIVMVPTTILGNTIVASGRAPNEARLVAYLETHLQQS